MCPKKNRQLSPTEKIKQTSSFESDLELEVPPNIFDSFCPQTPKQNCRDYHPYFLDGLISSCWVLVYDKYNFEAANMCQYSCLCTHKINHELYPVSFYVNQ